MSTERLSTDSLSVLFLLPLEGDTMKKTITEITEKFGTDGKIIERITKTTTEENFVTLPYTYPYGIAGTGTAQSTPRYAITATTTTL